MGGFVIDGPGPRVPSSGAGVLPFARSDLNETRQILVHFKLADDSPQMRLEVAQAITEALRPVRVNGHAIIPLVTDESVTMNAIDIHIITAHILPDVKRALGVA